MRDNLDDLHHVCRNSGQFIMPTAFFYVPCQNSLLPRGPLAILGFHKPFPFLLFFAWTKVPETRFYARLFIISG